MCDRVMVMYGGHVVEEGPTEIVFAEPRHPYTWSLLRSIPRLDSDNRERLHRIEGLPPDLARLPRGCRFHPRCPFRRPRCMEERPEMQPVRTAQRAACRVSQDRVDLGAAAGAIGR